MMMRTPTFCPQTYSQVNSEVSLLFSQTIGEIEETSVDEVLDILKNRVRGKGAPGEDGISNRVLKSLPYTYHREIAKIFNASLRLGYLPGTWKSALVVMIPKPKKDHKKPGNHRPISLLNTMSKLLERVIQVRIEKWISSNHLLSLFQSGFRKHRQTKDHILRLLDTGIASFNINQRLGALFVDIEKAFDKVWHNGLLYKLNKLGIPSYLGKWIQNYLTGRAFKVRCSSSISPPKLIHTGVPQGSVLGPVLFLLFFNDIAEPNPTLHDPGLALFADDLAAWYASTNNKLIQKRLQKCLTHVANWMGKWRSKASTTKTVYTIFNREGSISRHKLNLYYNEEEIAYEKNPKFLGVTLDPGLRLHKHASELVNRCHKTINVLKNLRGKNWGASTTFIIRTYKTLVRPVVDYSAITILLMAETNRAKIETIQRAAVRAATYWPPHISTKYMYDRVKLSPLLDRALTLTDNYTIKAYSNNELIREFIDGYRIAPQLREGLYAKNPRRTILGALANNPTAKASGIINQPA